MNKQGGWNGLTVLILVAVFLAGGFFFRQDGEWSANAQGPAANAGASALGPWQIIQPSSVPGIAVPESMSGGGVTHKLNTVTGDSWTFVYIDPRTPKDGRSYWLPAPNFLLKQGKEAETEGR